MSALEQEHADILMGDIVRLEDALSRDAAASVCRSFFQLFRVPVRVISQEGNLIADVHQDQKLCRYINEFLNGQTQCESTVGAVRDQEPTAEPIVHPCFTGAVYRVTPLEYQGRPVGRVIMGPYIPAEENRVPDSLLGIDPAMDHARAAQHFDQMPRIRKDIAEQLAGHLVDTLHLLTFSGHKAQLASTMQIANVRENYRELAQKTDKLEHAYEELKELDRLKSTFLATVSHELRTPLTSIIGYAEMMEADDNQSLSDGHAEYVKTIKERADHLLGLISNLIELGRLGAESLNIDKQPVDVSRLIADVKKTIGPAAEKKNIRVEANVSDSIPHVSGDPVRLRQVLLNLVQNAVKFTPESGAVDILVEQTQLEDGAGDGMAMSLFSSSRPAVAIVVRDNGIGIPRSEHSKIFNAFYQIDGSASREHGGAGLGLSIVKQLVDAHEGEIDVESDVGKGTTFVVTLPVDE